MRIPHLFLFVVSLLVSSFSFANTVEEKQNNTPDIDQEQVMPDAMSRLIKAPNIDIANIRDPFLSSFEKNRLEESMRFKNRKQLPINKRRREALEFFDLSTLSLVATFQKKGHAWVASVQDSTGKAYTVRRGDYVGKRGGRIEKIDGKTVYLVEQMLNPEGNIIDRQVTLTLSEVNDSY